MKEDRKSRLVHILKNADTWVPASTLAKMLGVSSRTVRSYISQLGKEYTVLSSQNGYRLAGKAKSEQSASHTVPDLQSDDSRRRATTLITTLLSSKESVSVYDIADDLGVSESTVMNAVVPPARGLAQDFGLTLSSRNFKLLLEGSERDKRRLLRYLVTQHSYGYFTSVKTLAQMFPGFDTSSIMSELVRICQDSDLFLNNYSLNNLLVHLMVIVVRMKAGDDSAAPEEFIDATQLIEHLRLHRQIAQCGDQIAHMLEDRCRIQISEGDFQQILLLIALSTDQFDYDELNASTMAQLVDTDFLNIVHGAAEETASRYGLEPFDEDFLMQLTLHSYNAYQRAVYGVSCVNPIGSQIKQSHPLVYDMAVYFCHKLERQLDTSMSEEELAFFAFHFGAYLASNIAGDDRISCTVVSERYHDYAGRVAASISDAFANRLTISRTIGYDDFLVERPRADLIVTTVPLPDDIEVCSVLVSPLVSRLDLKRIGIELDLIQQQRDKERARLFLKGLMHRELYLHNAHEDSVMAYLKLMGNLALEHGYVDEEFIHDVELRERTSSTAFIEGLAIPHSISLFAKRSFVCVLQSDEPIPWGRNDVNVVMMFGLSKADIHKLGLTFDVIIDRFSSTDSMRSIMESTNFDGFVSALLGN
ncbi:PRD domain-containing protein [Olsenella sp. Marseille-P4559]|uniref:BglG family transcription antiterminator n=1 Tax=Olsenella sp. Marseille-P4559 TaxID=2364795 RepID=UPI0013EF3F33|nr:PRD domain-containing protein [Olsenella sp. Marseille-P4559]